MENIEQPEDKLSGAQFDLDEGSMLGKFKDATSLLSAYNNLQAEFTRKSQKLAELTKQQTEELSERDIALADHSDQTNNTGNGVKKEDSCADASENSYCTSTDNYAENADFDSILSKKLLEFAENQPSAITSVEQIKSEINNNKDLLNLNNGIEIAYRLVREKQKSEPAEIVNDPKFINDYILSNEEITSAVVDRYIKSLASKSTTPKIISNDNASLVTTPTVNKPRTLSDANKIFTKMLEN